MENARTILENWAMWKLKLTETIMAMTENELENASRDCEIAAEDTSAWRESVLANKVLELLRAEKSRRRGLTICESFTDPRWIYKSFTRRIKRAAV